MRLAFFFGTSDFVLLDLRGALFTGFIALCACNAHLALFGQQWRSGAMGILERATTAPACTSLCARNAHFTLFGLQWRHEHLSTRDQCSCASLCACNAHFTLFGLQWRHEHLTTRDHSSCTSLCEKRLRLPAGVTILFPRRPSPGHVPN